MASPDAEWCTVDTWIFAAIAMYERRCSLAELVASADMINHAIPLDAEVEAALGKLTGAGLVRVYDDWTFETTDEGESLWSGDARDLHTHLDALTAELAHLEPGRTQVKLPPGAMDTAIRDYHRDAAGG